MEHRSCGREGRQRHHDPSERRAGRRERRHRETRDEILVAAREVLLERGAADLSLREIARRAEFSVGALYKYFTSKDDIVKALADQAMGALHEAFTHIDVDLAADERALELGMAYLDFARRNPEDVAVIALHESLPLIPPSFEHARLEDTVVRVFRAGINTGLFASSASDDADFMAYGAWALAQGLATLEQRQRPETAARLRAKQRQLLLAYLNGLRVDGPASPPLSRPHGV
ncbi:MAG: TetR/AcrR family transcriptional regulator [Thermoleophilia bacterium]